jgi:hypothetical protein
MGKLRRLENRRATRYNAQNRLGCLVAFSPLPLTSVDRRGVGADLKAGAAATLPRGRDWWYFQRQ